MEDLELVIEIPNEIYQNIIKNGFLYDEDSEVVSHAVINGVLLPKGHGRLIDVDALENYIKEDADEWDEYALAYVEDAPTIVEADKEEVE